MVEASHTPTTYKLVGAANIPPPRKLMCCVSQPHTNFIMPCNSLTRPLLVRNYFVQAPTRVCAGGWKPPLCGRREKYSHGAANHQSYCGNSWGNPTCQW